MGTPDGFGRRGRFWDSVKGVSETANDGWESGNDGWESGNGGWESGNGGWQSGNGGWQSVSDGLGFGNGG